jgi:ankyrin repeat protein
MSKARILEAVQKLDLPTARKLLDAKPELLNVTDRTGRNLLHIACSAYCQKLRLPESTAVRMADFLLDRGLDIESAVPDKKCDVGCTPLFFAVARGRNPTLVTALLKRGASPKRAPGGGLFAAGWYDDTKSLALLLRAGAEIDVVAGVTPFLASWCWKKFEAAKFLAQRGANVNFQNPKNGKTALHYGLEKEFDPALLKWLVKHGASPDIKDSNGVTAREKASRKRHEKWAAAMS